MRTRRTDDELLTSTDPEAFGIFYARHSAGVEAYFARRVGRQHAADLAAETFASALVARRRFLPATHRRWAGCTRSRRAAWSTSTVVD